MKLTYPKAIYTGHHANFDGYSIWMLVIKDKKVLLGIREQDGTLAPPMGKRNNMFNLESRAKGAVRELFEETGINVELKINSSIKGGDKIVTKGADFSQIIGYVEDKYHNKTFFNTILLIINPDDPPKSGSDMFDLKWYDVNHDFEKENILPGVLLAIDLLKKHLG